MAVSTCGGDIAARRGSSQQAGTLRGHHTRCEVAALTSSRIRPATCATSGTNAGELRGEVAMPVRSQACLCTADVHSRHAAEAFKLLGGAQVLSVSVFAARQASDPGREWRCHRTWHSQLASSRDDAREVACEAEHRCDLVADRGVCVEVRLHVDVRIALARLYPPFARGLGRLVALSGLPTCRPVPAGTRRARRTISTIRAAAERAGQGFLADCATWSAPMTITRTDYCDQAEVRRGDRRDANALTCRVQSISRSGEGGASSHAALRGSRRRPFPLGCASRLWSGSRIGVPG